MNTTISASSTVSSTLLAVPHQLNIWFGSFLWITGNLGCIGSMIVFGSSTFRHRAYSIYLFFQAISDAFYFDFVLLTRVLQKGFKISVTHRFDIICRCRQFSSVWGNQISFTLFSFATIDRLLSAQLENKYRQWSNRVSLAYKLTIGCLAVWFLPFAHRLIFYHGGNGICGLPEGPFADFDNYFEVVVVGLVPPIVISILAYLLIRSVRKVIQRKTAPVNQMTQGAYVRRTALQQMDAQLTLMLILQSIITMITYVPYAVELIYTNVVQNYSKSPLRKAKEKVFTEAMHLVAYIFFATGFYVSLLCSNGFRRQLKKIILNEKRTSSTGTTQNVFRMETPSRTQ